MKTDFESDSPRIAKKSAPPSFNGGETGPALDFGFQNSIRRFERDTGPRVLTVGQSDVVIGLNRAEVAMNAMFAPITKARTPVFPVDRIDQSRSTSSRPPAVGKASTVEVSSTNREGATALPL